MSIDPSRQKLHRQTKILAALAIGMILTIAAASASIWQLSRFSSETEAIQHSHEVAAQIDAVLTAATEIQTALRGYVITNNSRFLEPYQKAADGIEERGHATAALLADHPAQSERAQRLRQLIRERLTNAKTLFDLRQQGGFEAAQAHIAAGDGEANLAAIRQQAAEIVAAESALRQQRSQQSDRSRQGTLIAATTGSTLSVLLAGLALVLIRRDVSGRGKFEVALRASEALAQRQLAELQAIYDSIPLGLCVLDRKMRYVRVNPRLAAINGVAAADHIGKTVDEIIPSLAPKAHELAGHIFRTGEEMTGVELSGATLTEPAVIRTWIEQWLPLKDGNGQIVAINVIVEDITDRKRAEETLRRTTERLEIAQWGARSGAWDWDIIQGRFDWSREMFELFGLDPQRDEAGFESWRGALHPDDCAAAEERIAAALRDGTLLDNEYRIVLADGSVRWINALGRTTHAPSGEATRMAGLCIDITERKQAEAKRRASEEMLRFALDSTQTGLWQWDLASGMLESTAQNLRLFGLPDNGSQPSPDVFSALIHPDDLDRISASFGEALKGESRYDAEYRIRRPDGEERWIHSVGSVSKDERGQPHFVGISRDITERKRNEEALLDADRRKDEFLATLAHELRNPLAPLSAALEIMRMAGDAAHTPPGLRAMMERQVTQLVRLVSDLLEVSRITRGKIELRKERVSLATVMDHALETSQPLIQAQAHAVRVSLPPEPLVVEADPMRLTQVIANLLNNAAKYMDKGGSIRVAAERHGDEAVLSVRDEGIGIAAEHLPRVFDLFGQIDRSLNRAQSGLGIGLALVRRLVEMHGGRVEARSEGLGRGSEFVVHLPLAARVQEVIPASEPSSPGEPSPHRVLVVDDNRDAADTLAMLVKGLGSTLRVAYEGASALEILPVFDPDIVLLDLGMPGMDGYEVARRIRQSPKGAGIVLVAVTGWGEEKDRARTRAAGFDHHLVKPVRVDALNALLNGLQPPPVSGTPTP